MNEVSKFRCHVYGCTIPTGISHKHDQVAENYAAVMRDPSTPLTRDERAELESFRRERDWLTREGLKAFSQHSTASMVPGRKLTQALLDAGRLHREGHNDLAFYDESKAKWQDNPVTIDQAPAPRRSFVSLTARVAFWIVLAVTVAIWIFAGVKS